MLFSTEGFFEVAKESWPELDSVQTLLPMSYQAMSST